MICFQSPREIFFLKPAMLYLSPVLLREKKSRKMYFLFALNSVSWYIENVAQ